MKTEIFEEYAILDAEEKALKAKKEALRIQILAELIDAGAEKLDTHLGKFTVTQLKKWTYPEEVVELGENFKAAKAKSESTGEATYVEEPSLRFTTLKL